MSNVGVWAIVIAGLLAACGPGEVEVPGPEGPADDVPASPPQTPGGGEAVVQMRDFAFEPAGVSVPSGADVALQLRNSGQVSHTFTVEDLAVDVTVEPAGVGVATFSAPDPGTYEFICRFHPGQMTGELIVE
ncbi:MAG TPA: cupredoxin domain-containing protein [Egibacteraceae bacterium]|nr:cupredoxin domain-containing protein [Egibacteraceae bacterium]